MQNLSYEEILKMKEKCYQVIKDQLGEDYLKVFKYFKGDLLPLISTKCRRTMTTGDMDSFEWDFIKKKLRFIENKRTSENNKESQSKFLKWLSENVTIKDPTYKFSVYKSIGDPPFNKTKIIHIKSGAEKEFDHDELIKFLDM